MPRDLFSQVMSHILDHGMHFSELQWFKGIVINLILVFPFEINSIA